MTDSSPWGFQDSTEGNSEFNASRAMVDQVLSRVHTATIVRIKAIRGGVGPVGTVDVEPLVNMTDGQGKAVEHGTVYQLPYLRCQGGTNAVIMDPEVGDLGVAVFANRDTTGVRHNKDKALPGSRRMFSMADGIYMGGTLNNTPSNYVSFLGGKVTVTSPVEVVINSPTLTINSNNVVFTGASITHGGKHIDNTHTHAEHDGGNTGPPL